MKIDTTRITLAGQLAGNIPDGAEVRGLVLDPIDRLHSALVRIPATGIYITMCGDVARSVDQREAQRAVDDAGKPRDTEPTHSGMTKTVFADWLHGLHKPEIRERNTPEGLLRSYWAECENHYHGLCMCEVPGRMTTSGNPVAFDFPAAWFDDADTESGATLYDSETTETVTAEDLGITAGEYTSLVKESLQCTETEGHVKTDAGRRVYAD